jgi:hypothetical protein
VVRLLLDHRANPKLAFTAAASVPHPDPAIIQMILEAGARIQNTLPAETKRSFVETDEGTIEVHLGHQASLLPPPSRPAHSGGGPRVGPTARILPRGLPDAALPPERDQRGPPRGCRPKGKGQGHPRIFWCRSSPREGGVGSQARLLGRKGGDRPGASGGGSPSGLRN